MLRTPLDGFESILGGLSAPQQGGANQSSFVTLSPVGERDLLNNQLEDTGSTTPSQLSNAIEVQVHPPPGKVKEQQVEVDPQQVIKRERSASWNDLKAAFTQSKRRLSPSNASPEPSSPTTPTFLNPIATSTDTGEGNEESKSLFGRSRAESQPAKVGSGGGIFLARSIFASKGSKAEKEEAKARAKAEKAAGQERATTPSTPTSPSFSYTPSMESSDAPMSPKVAKAMEKSRRKEEQKRKLEQLAVQLKAGNKKGQDGLSFTTSSSGEQRKNANHWIEETDGMFGGNLSTWGGL